jgi:predicted nucleotidyltransferase
MTTKLDKHLSLIEQEAIKEFYDKLLAMYPKRLDQVILFGSKARGDSHQESDIDILVVVDNSDWRFRHTISDIASDVSLNYDVLIGPKVISRDRWHWMKQKRFSFYKNVSNEAIVLMPE